MGAKKKTDPLSMTPDSAMDANATPEQSQDRPSEDEASARSRIFTHVGARIHTKIAGYASHQFTVAQARCLNIFFELAQELDELEELCALTVLLPEILFRTPAELFLLNPSGDALVRQTPEYGPTGTPPSLEDLAAGTRKRDGLLLVPLQKRKEHRQPLPFIPAGDNLGMLVYHTTGASRPHDLLFYQKFANCAGFQLHNKLLLVKSTDHLRFINNLVHDIGHNVIVPNMHFKLLFRQLEEKIRDLSGVRKKLENAAAGAGGDLASSVAQLGRLHDMLEEQYCEVYKYFLQSSIFLETLLRQSHFEKGHYVLQKRMARLAEHILQPQMERYCSQFEERGIAATLECSAELQVSTDIGLVSQVVANLLSNAVKYTRPSPANAEKTVTVTGLKIENAFGPGKPGVQIQVLSSGPHIDPEEVPHLFKPDFRASNSREEDGTGHGLYFIYEIITSHDGSYGYEAAPSGNAFSFTLPLDAAD